MTNHPNAPCEFTLDRAVNGSEDNTIVKHNGKVETQTKFYKDKYLVCVCGATQYRGRYYA